MPDRILVLAGTLNARMISAELVDSGHFVIASLAGATSDPKSYPCEVRSGGFGGAQGLEKYLRDHAIDCVVDATHRFAHTISANARSACTAAGVTYINRMLNAWEKPELNAWTSFSNDASIAKFLKHQPSATVFLAVGSKYIAAYYELVATHRVIARAVKFSPPDRASGIECIEAKGPFSLEQEKNLFESYKIDYLVCRNSGEVHSYTKIAAASDLGIDILMIESGELT